MPGHGLGTVCCLGDSYCLQGLLQHHFASAPWLPERCREQGILAVEKWGSSLGEDGETELCRNEPVAEQLCGKRREGYLHGDTRGHRAFISVIHALQCCLSVS